MLGGSLGRVLLERSKLDGPERLADLLEMGFGLGTIDESIDYVLHADHPGGGSQNFFDQVVISERGALVVLGPQVASLVDEVSNDLLRGVTESDVVLDQEETLDNFGSGVKEDYVVHFLETIEVQYFLSLRGNVVGP